MSTVKTSQATFLIDIPNSRRSFKTIPMDLHWIVTPTNQTSANLVSAHFGFQKGFSAVPVGKPFLVPEKIKFWFKVKLIWVPCRTLWKGSTQNPK